MHERRWKIIGNSICCNIAREDRTTVHLLPFLKRQSWLFKGWFHIGKTWWNIGKMFPRDWKFISVLRIEISSLRRRVFSWNSLFYPLNPFPKTYFVAIKSISVSRIENLLFETCCPYPFHWTLNIRIKWWMKRRKIIQRVSRDRCRSETSIIITIPKYLLILLNTFEFW